MKLGSDPSDQPPGTTARLPVTLSVRIRVDAGPTLIRVFSRLSDSRTAPAFVGLSFSRKGGAPHSDFDGLHRFQGTVVWLHRFQAPKDFRCLFCSGLLSERQDDDRIYCSTY